MSPLEGVERLAGLLRRASPCVVLTGAGISTASGIPDFRSRTGIWESVDPLAVATIEAFDADPVATWGFYGPRYRMLAAATPNDAHSALAELERRGVVRAVVTQNIDLLHERAGSETVVEVHGSIRNAVCRPCGRAEPLDGVLRQLDERPAPVCPSCGSVLKPGVVMFGEMLPPRAFDRAQDLVRGAGVVLAIGSTLAVWPVAGLALEGGALAIVNRGPTDLDSRAAVRIDADAGETLTTLLAGF